MFLGPLIRTKLRQSEDDDGRKVIIAASTSSSVHYSTAADELACVGHIRSDIVVNKTGKTLYVKNLAGYVYELPPVHCQAEELGVVEYHTLAPWNTVGNKFGDNVTHKNAGGADEFNDVLKYFIEKRGNIEDGSRSADGRLFLTRVYRTEDIASATRGLAIENSDVMLFTDHDLAYDTGHFMEHRTKPNWLNSTGIELRLYAPRYEYTNVFANLGGETIEVPIVVSDEEPYVEINIRDLDGNPIKTNRYSAVSYTHLTLPTKA